MKNQFLESVKKIYRVFLSNNPWGTAPMEDEFDDPKDLELIKKLIAPIDYNQFGRIWRMMLMDANINHPVEFVETFDIKSADDFVKKFKAISQNY